VVHVEQGGAVVMGRRGCQGWSWKGRKGAPAQGGGRGGDSQAEVWPEESARHEKQRQGVSGRRRSKRGSSSAGYSPHGRTRRWRRAAKP
jgi:hypothetical protein